MILSLMTALLIAGASAEAESYAAEAQARMLAGQSLPRDFRRQLAALEPVDRFAVVIWLRRTGLLTGPAVPIEAMLAPARAPDGTAREGTAP